jgi:shikimate kinase
MAHPESRDSDARNPERVSHAVVLVGFMGAGKTTVGRYLAKRLGWRFIDLDDRVESAAGQTIADIFRDSGEPAFRALETAALRRVLDETATGIKTVIAVGGGAYAHATNAEAVRRSGIHVVFLDAPIEELRRRCTDKGGVRPLFEDADRFRRLYEDRRESYLQADMRVETTAKSIEAVANEVISMLGVADE